MSTPEWYPGVTVVKDPDATLDYGLNLRDLNWLASGENVASLTVTVDTGITKDSSSYTDDQVLAWLSGGTAGTSYKVTFSWTTDSVPARSDERTITIKVENR